MKHSDSTSYIRLQQILFFFFFISDTLFLARLQKPWHHNFPQFFQTVKYDFRYEANTDTTIGNCVFLHVPVYFPIEAT